MVVLPVDATGNPLIWFICKYTPWVFPSCFPGTDFPCFTYRNHQDLSDTYQAKVTTLPVPPYSIIILNVPPTINQYMVISPYSKTNIFLLVLGGASYPLRFFWYIYFNHNFIFTNCSIYSIHFLQLRPWIYPCIVRLSFSMTKFNKIIIPGPHYRISHATFLPYNHHP